ncbi:TAXI family TRAP transporter solute-binding subunit [uncultured Amaricoccus sp.]|uniref:TAXI family TRAP transporter solute-binding subunit n=1 Tax=uncultured Amaricoccus sp. TaxID=339341 RepID=UPI002624F397|nr:TAXI family TRAP transporter solute-binding subunit [uncultured Amaricoccus sp.]
MLRALAILAAVFAGPVHAQGLNLFSLGSGEVGGSYFAAASAICESVNRAHRGVLRCSPEATPGSRYNIEALRTGQLDFAMVQSDWQAAVFLGKGQYAAQGPMTDLRSVMSLYPEALTVLARRDAGIASLTDLTGKRVDVGPPASGRRATVLRILEKLGENTDSFGRVFELPTGGAISELCAGRLDATLLIVGHPNSAVAKALADCDAELLPMAGPAVEAALDGNTEYVPFTIPMATYPQLSADLPTWSVIATVVTRADMDADLVRALVASTLDTLRPLAMRAPVLGALDPVLMRSQGLSAPLHPGAAAAFSAFLAAAPKP